MVAPDAKGEPPSRRRKRLPNIVPAWERGNSARQFSRAPAAALPVVAEDGRVARKFPTARAGSKRKASGQDGGAGEDAGNGLHREDGEVVAVDRGNGLPVSGKDEKATGRKKRRMGAKNQTRTVADYAAEMEKVERAKAQIAAMASAVVANPEQNLKNLGELRTMAKSSNRTVTTLIILTESQLYKDICPAYRIRTISEEEASVKVSKDVAALRNYEQGLLTAYTRFVRSTISLSKWSAGSTSSTREGGGRGAEKSWSEAEKKMHKLRRAACTALCEISRALLHFNLASEVASAVAGLTSDRDAAVRKEAAAALTEVLGEAHKCAGTSLSARVQVADQLSKAVVHSKSLAQAETISPLLHIRFAFFSKFTKSRGGKKETKKAFNRKHRTKKSSTQADKEAREAVEKERQDRLDLERDMREAHAEATPEELFTAKKSLLNSVCKACFNVIKAASESALAGAAARGGDGDEKTGRESRTRRPPPALAHALEGTLLVASLLQGDLVDAILAALSPILEGDTLPLAIRFRSLAAAYSILAAHAAEQRVDADSFTRDARAMDSCLYVALGQLYGPGSPLSADEAITAEALRAIGAAYSGRRMPPVRLAAFARRLGVSAAALAPTHGCTVGLLSSMQVMLPATLVECLFPVGADVAPGASGKNATEFGEDGGLVQEFDFEAEDPDTAGAEHSAAWELAALSAHFHPSVQAVAKQICGGVCGDRRPTGAVDPPGIAEAHSSAKGGFNPPPLSTFKGRKTGVSASRQKGWQSVGGIFSTLSDSYGSAGAATDDIFPADAFSSLWESSGSHESTK